jgi:chromosome segregation ATPase
MALLPRLRGATAERAAEAAERLQDIPDERASLQRRLQELEREEQAAKAAVAELLRSQEEQRAAEQAAAAAAAREALSARYHAAIAELAPLLEATIEANERIWRIWLESGQSLEIFWWRDLLPDKPEVEFQSQLTVWLRRVRALGIGR